MTWRRRTAASWRRRATLVGQLLARPVRPVRHVGLQRRPIDGDRVRIREPFVRTEPERLAEEIGYGRLVKLSEAGEGGVVGGVVGRHRAAEDRFTTS